MPTKIQHLKDWQKIGVRCVFETGAVIVFSANHDGSDQQCSVVAASNTGKAEARAKAFVKWVNSVPGETVEQRIGRIAAFCRGSKSVMELVKFIESPVIV